MAQEKESFLDNLFRIMALMGGAWITVELLKIFAKKIYECPHCSGEVQERTSRCPHCGVKLGWKI